MRKLAAPCSNSAQIVACVSASSLLVCRCVLLSCPLSRQCVLSVCIYQWLIFNLEVTKAHNATVLATAAVMTFLSHHEWAQHIVFSYVLVLIPFASIIVWWCTKLQLSPRKPSSDCRGCILTRS